MKIPKELKVRDAVIETQRLKMNQMAFQIQLLSRSSSRNMSKIVFYINGTVHLGFGMVQGPARSMMVQGKLVPPLAHAINHHQFSWLSDKKYSI